MIFLSAYDLTAAPPTTEAGALKRRSGRQKGIEGTSLVCCVHSRRADQTLAAQTASDQEDCILRLEARLLAIERTLQDIQVQLKALASGMQDILAMTTALCTHFGITPSLRPGSNATAAATSIHSQIPEPVTEFAARSPAGVTSNAGGEDEEPSQVCPSLVPCLWKVINELIQEVAWQTSDNGHDLAARLVVLQGRMDGFEEWMKGVDRRLKDAGL
jgi:hypothetical protein